MEETKTEISPLLRAASSLSECLSSLTTAAAKLEEKRATLEEKMIKRYFHEIAVEIADGSLLIHQILSSGKPSVDNENADAVCNIAADILNKMQEFHKAIDYDWNYLEQYFEHGFYLELTESSHLLEKIRAVISKLKKDAST